MAMYQYKNRALACYQYARDWNTDEDRELYKEIKGYVDVFDPINVQVYEFKNEKESKCATLAVAFGHVIYFEARLNNKSARHIVDIQEFARDKGFKLENNIDYMHGKKNDYGGLSSVFRLPLYKQILINIKGLKANKKLQEQRDKEKNQKISDEYEKIVEGVMEPGRSDENKASLRQKVVTFLEKKL